MLETDTECAVTLQETDALNGAELLNADLESTARRVLVCLIKMSQKMSKNKFVVAENENVYKFSELEVLQ